jgi:hypothetical protein
MSPAAVYVYGVMPAAEGDAAISVKGVEGAEVHTVQHAGLAALTSDLDTEALTAAREVRAHWRVLEEASKGSTVLPTRFGTVMESDEAVREHLLEPNAERLESMLRRLAGRVQLGVKGDYDERELMREVVRGSPAVAALRDRLRALPGDAGYYQRIRLGELVANQVERQRQADTQFALDSLRPLAADAREEQPSGAHAAFNLAFLVERAQQDAFTEAVNALAENFGERVNLRYVGPVPPYSFAEADLTVGSEAWA